MVNIFFVRLIAMKSRDSKIDPKIRRAVSALNKIDIPTTSSCQGHSTYSSPAPWIKITAKNEPKSKTAEVYEGWVEENLERNKSRLTPIPWKIKKSKPTKAYKKWDKENFKLRKFVSSLLSEFYKDRRTPKDTRIVIESAKRGFWIHNGGESYIKWRKKGNETVRKREAGKIIKSKTINPAEIIRRKKKLPIYQREMIEFAAFLNAKAKNDKKRGQN